MKYLLILLAFSSNMALSDVYPRSIQKCQVNDPAASLRFHSQQDAYIDKLLTLIERLREDKTYETEPVEPKVIVKYAAERPKHMFSLYAGIGPAGLESSEQTDGTFVTTDIDFVGAATYHYRFWEGISITGGLVVSINDPSATTVLGGLSTGW